MGEYSAALIASAVGLAVLLAEIVKTLIGKLLERADGRGRDKLLEEIAEMKLKQAEDRLRHAALSEKIEKVAESLDRFIRELRVRPCIAEKENKWNG